MAKREKIALLDRYLRQTVGMATSQQNIACTIMRGGTSRGAYFLGDDLPRSREDRDAVLRAVMGGPDDLQVDGIGGGHPLTSKVAVVSRSQRQDADVEYLFLQVTPSTGKVNDGQNCGNLLAGVGPFAIEQGLVAAGDASTTVRVYMVNSGNLCEVIVQTPGGVVEYAGGTAIDGVPGTAAPVVCNYLDIAGSVTGALLPTGNIRDTVDGIDVTCIDNGMPVVLLRAADLGCTGREPPGQLDANSALKQKLEVLRGVLGPKMNLGDVTDKTVPKMCLVSGPNNGGLITTRMFIPHDCHKAIGVLAAVSVATACLLEGSITHGIAEVPKGVEKTMDIEHPSGSFRVLLQIDKSAEPHKLVTRAGVIRTARMLMRGDVFVPPVI